MESRFGNKVNGDIVNKRAKREERGLDIKYSIMCESREIRN